jgi:hypothetical protein
MQQSLDKQQIKLPGRAGDTVFSDKRTSTTNNNKKYHFVSTPKKRGFLFFDTLAWPQQLQVKSKAQK